MGAASGDRWDKGHSMRSSRTNGRGAHDVCCVSRFRGPAPLFRFLEKCPRANGWARRVKTNMALLSQGGGECLLAALYCFQPLSPQGGPEGRRAKEEPILHKKRGIVVLDSFLIFRLIYLRPHFQQLPASTSFWWWRWQKQRGQQHLPFSDWKDNCHSNVEFRFSWNRITWTIVLRNQRYSTHKTVKRIRPCIYI